jgi:hypothetical protein
MTRPGRHIFCLLIVIACGFRLGAILLLHQTPGLDEPIHIEVTRQFGTGFPAPAQLRDYQSATGPLFYVLFGNLGAPLGYNLTALRVMVFVLALAGLVLFHRVLRRLLPKDDPWPALALLATGPYYLALGGLFMTEHLALLLGLASLLGYLRFRENGRWTEAARAMMIATAFAAASIFESPRRWPSALPWLLPVLAFLPLALTWRGLAPPSLQDRYHPGVNAQNASSVLIWTGVFLLPWLWSKLRPWHLVALLAVPVVLLAPLPGLGFTRTVLKLLPHPLAVTAACLFGIIGLLWFIRLAPLVLGRDTIRNPRRVSVMSHSLPVAAIGALLLAAGLLVSGPAVYERYLLPGYALMVACARPGTKPWLALTWAALFQLPVTVIHILHLAA